MKTPKEIIFEYSSKTKSELTKVEQLNGIYEGSFTLTEVIGLIKTTQEEAKVFSSNAVLSNPLPSESESEEKLKWWHEQEGMNTYSEEYKAGMTDGWELCDEWMRKRGNV